MNTGVQVVSGLLVSVSIGSEIRTACVHTCFYYVLGNYFLSLDFTKTLLYMNKHGSQNYLVRVLLCLKVSVRTTRQTNA